MRKRGVALLLSFPVALSLLTGCQRHSYSETYYLISNNMALPYWQTAIAGFNRAGRTYGVKTITAGPNTFDAQAELQALQNAVQAKPKGILISVADPAVLGPEIDNAISAGIPVITIDSDAPQSHRIFFIGTNNREAGHLGGQRVVEKLGGKGNVVFFTMPGQPNLDERLKGYQEVFAAHPGIKTADVVNIKGDSGNAFDATQRLVAQTGAGKIDAYICLEASAGKDVGEVLKRQSNKEHLLIAMDLDPDTLNLIKDGVIDTTIAQKPYTMGYVGLKMLDEIFHYPPTPIRTDYEVNTFSPYPVFVDTGTAAVNKENVDTYVQQEQEAVQK